MSWPGWEDYTPPSTSDPLRPSKRSKYGAVKTEVDGITFDSKKEAARYVELRMLEKAGEITGLECQPAYDLTVLGTVVGKFIPDFRYVSHGQVVIEDVKSPPTKTPIWRWKVKHLKAEYGVNVIEI